MDKIFVIFVQVSTEQNIDLENYTSSYNGGDVDTINYIISYTIENIFNSLNGVISVNTLTSGSTGVTIEISFKYEVVKNNIESIITQLRSIIESVVDSAKPERVDVQQELPYEIIDNKNDISVNTSPEQLNSGGWSLIYLIKSNSTEKLNEEISESTTDPDIQNDSNVESNNEDEESQNSDTENQTENFQPVKLTQLVQPEIKPTQIAFNTGNMSPKDKKELSKGLGTAPLIYYNGIQLNYQDISMFELYHEGILPAIKITFTDTLGLFRGEGFPLDDTTITIFIYSRSKILRSIYMDFKITKFQDLGGYQYTISGISNIPDIYIRKFKSLSKMTSFEALKEIAKDCKLGFCTNINNTNDKMTWIDTGFPYHKFITNIVENSYMSDTAFLTCYIDFYYNLCYVELDKEINRDVKNDKMIFNSGRGDIIDDDTKDETVTTLVLTTDGSARDTNAFISFFQIKNRSTSVALNSAYLTKTKFYDAKNKELLIFNIDSQTSKSNDSIILKGKPSDEDFFKSNINNIWVGKLDKFEDDGSGNMHSNYNYALIQNRRNIEDLSKVSMKVKLGIPNFNLFVYQKVPVFIVFDKPGALQNSLTHKRVTGDWLITNINYIYDGSAFYQEITMIIRELQADSNEVST